MTSPFTQTPNFVIPAKAEIHGLTVPRGGQSRPWIPDQVGNDKVMGLGERRRHARPPSRNQAPDRKSVV